MTEDNLDVRTSWCHLVVRQITHLEGEAATKSVSVHQIMNNGASVAGHQDGIGIRRPPVRDMLVKVSKGARQDVVFTYTPLLVGPMGQT
jgi:hypothetical protein